MCIYIYIYTNNSYIYPIDDIDCWLAMFLHTFCTESLNDIHLQSVSGTALKKELRQIADVCLELPATNAVRKTLEKYKTRFEELLEEPLDCTQKFWHVTCTCMVLAPS